MRKYFMLIIVLAILILTVACSAPRISLFADSSFPLKEFTLEGSGVEKVLLIPVEGIISDAPQKGVIRSSPSMVQKIVSQLKKAEKDKQIKAVLLKINSPGGTITASDILYHEIMTFKERTGAKILVSMMDIATSGGYYISLPADMIMAHPTTVTGSVGVIFLRPKLRGLMDKIGVGVDVSKFGKNKDMGSPFRDYSEEEQILIQKTVDDMGQRFIGLVQKHRKPQPPALAVIATARLFLAEEAVNVGLVDKTGYLGDAVRESKKLAGIPADARLVVYRRTEYSEDNMYNVAGVASEDLHMSVVNIDLPESLGLNTGFYYLWPAAISSGR
ncbi:MAG: signal peptide peptidase SppA [Syntrophales bacterium LBB04]|nr:signal peptide peptidase SppA [Syntrophales bacterium LBB04]